MNEILVAKFGLAPEFVAGGLPLLLFTFSAFCLLGFTGLVMRARTSGAPIPPGRSTFAILLLLLGLLAFMVAITLKIA